MNVDPDPDRRRLAERASAESASPGRIGRLQRINSKPWGEFLLSIAIQTAVVLAVGVVVFLVLNLFLR